MARSHADRHSPRLRQAAGAARWLARAAAVAAALAACGLPLLAGLAQAGTGGRDGVSGRGQAAGPPLQLSVTSVNPAYARAGQTLTITGRVRNASAAPASNLSVQLWSSTSALPTRSAIEDYAHGTYSPPGLAPVAGVAPATQAQLAPGGGWTWTVHVPVSKLGLGCFGVYPLTAMVSDSAGAPLDHDQIPLPYWPAKHVRCAGRAKPQPFPISWVWPLIDTPHQAPCGDLTDSSLAARIAPGGRLSTLLEVGARFATAASLTWAIDPALLDNVRTMSRPHLIGASCLRRRSYPGNQQARAWLADLVKATKGRPVFVTPYSDVDVQALNRFGDPFINLAFTDGDVVAHQVLGRDEAPAALPAGSDKLSAVAWPVGGSASPGVLEKLALNVSTVILTMPPGSPGAPTGGAVSKVLTGISRSLHILLADHSIAELLGSPDAGSKNPAAIFRVSQLYLAETAQIAAEAPGMVRPILVTPPRRWSPAPQLATALLAETAHAPWLTPSTVGQLVSMPARRASLPPPQPGRELPRRLLRRVSALDRQVSLLESIRLTQNPELYRAVFGIESSSWRGKRAKHAEALLTAASRYVRSQLRGLSINVSPYVTLGGKVSTIPVSIHNSLGYSVRVRLILHSTGAKVTLPTSAPVRVFPRSYSTIRVTVRTTGSDQGVIRMSLASPGGTPLAATSRTTHVKATDFGTVALVICAAALAVFVAASAGRALRHGKPGTEAADGAAPGAAPGGAPGGLPGTVPGEADSVGPGHGTTGEPDVTAGHDLGAGPRRDGWATAGAGSPDPQSRPDYPGSVLSERSELTSAGHAATEQEPAAQAQRPTEEHR